MYKQNRYRFPDAIEVEQYHTGKYGAPGQKREAPANATPEQIQRRNDLNKKIRCRRKLRAHFTSGDYFATLTYRKDARPANMDQAVEDWKKFIRKVRKEYQKRGAELKWIRNIEVGTKGAWHIHMVINRIPDTDEIIDEAWGHGMTDFKHIRKMGDMEKIASYITKSPRTEKRLKESSYSSSRNLPIPKPETRVIMRWPTWQEPIVKKGWYLDKESMHEGINPVTGYRYRTYTLLRLKGGESEAVDRIHIRGSGR